MLRIGGLPLYPSLREKSLRKAAFQSGLSQPTESPLQGEIRLCVQQVGGGEGNSIVEDLLSQSFVGENAIQLLAGPVRMIV